jgi:hypothetical protein
MLQWYYTYWQEKTCLGKDCSLLVVEVIPQILINGLQFFPNIAIGVVAIVFNRKTTP